MADVKVDPAAIAFLGRVGFSEDLASAIALAGEVLRRLALVAKPEGTEYAVMLDAATGAAAGREVRGTVVGEVEFAPLQTLIRAGRRYVLLHTHTLGSFSLDDARLFAATPQLDALLAIGRDGRWYCFSGAAGAARAELADLDQAYLREVNRLRRALAARILRGQLTETEALAEIEHLVWEAISTDVGFRYDRSG